MDVRPPLSYRWLRANGIRRLTPWHFVEEREGKGASAQFAKEDPDGRSVYTFAYRQDCDDFAGFTIINGQATDQVICYHPTFCGSPNTLMIDGTYPDIWAFLREVVIPDTASWLTDESDIEDLEHPKA